MFKIDRLAGVCFAFSFLASTFTPSELRAEQVRLEQEEPESPSAEEPVERNATIAVRSIRLNLENAREIVVEGDDIVDGLNSRLMKRKFLEKGKTVGDLALDGVITDLHCDVRPNLSCRVLVEWTLTSNTTGRVVYAHPSWAVAGNLWETEKDGHANAQALLNAALVELLRRPLLLELRANYWKKLEESILYEAKTFARCKNSPRVLPRDADDAMNAVVFIDVGEGHGSGFLFSEGPFVLTAAHVVQNGKIRVKFRDGRESSAVVVRRNDIEDVALLRLEDITAAHECVELGASDGPKLGHSVYALGAPMSEDLAFSITSGIVSGHPRRGDLPLIQTDAPVSPGNSGGPLMANDGTVVGIVTAKLVGRGSEGVAFARPIGGSLDALRLEAGATTSASLLEEKFTRKKGLRLIEDPAIARPELGMTRVSTKSEDFPPPTSSQVDSSETPGYVQALRWGGLATMGVGLTVLAIGAGSDASSRGEMMAIGGAGIGLGGTLFLISFAVGPTKKQNGYSSSFEPSWAGARTRESAGLSLGWTGAGVKFSGAF